MALKIKPKAPKDAKGNRTIPNPAAKRLVPRESAQEWWNLPEDSPAAASAVTERVKRLQTMQQAERTGMTLDALMYRGVSADTLMPALGLPSLLNSGAMSRFTGPTHNIISSVVDTVVSRIALNKPKATFLTSKGNWDQREQAEGLTDYCAGLFEQERAYELGPDIATDACVWPTGIVKVYSETDAEGEERVCWARTMRPLLFIDSAEGFARDPRQMYERRFTTKERLLADFGEEKRYIIESAAPASDTAIFLRPSMSVANCVEVTEAWKLPDAPGAKGRHIICTTNGCLFDEPWEEDHFPFVFLRWKMPRLGFWGISLAEELRSIQLKINRLDKRIDELMRRLSVGRVWLPAGAKVPKPYIGNQIGAVIQYSGGQKPIIDNANTVPPELLAERDAEMQKAYALAGVSQLAAQGVVPQGLKSGEALKVHLDIQTQRFSIFEQAYAQFFMDLAKESFRLISRMKKPFEVKLSGHRTFRKVQFSKVKDGSYIMKLSPTNYMADSPEDRLDQAIDLGDAGILDKVEMVDAIDYPDLKSITATKTAGIRNIRWLISQLYKKNYIDPKAIQDLDHGIAYVQGEALELMQEDAPEAVRDMFDRWLAEATALKKSMMPPPMAPGGPPPGGGLPTPGAPIASGQPAPVSQLLQKPPSP